jgi:hypothetical protein
MEWGCGRCRCYDDEYTIQLIDSNKIAVNRTPPIPYYIEAAVSIFSNAKLPITSFKPFNHHRKLASRPQTATTTL